MNLDPHTYIYNQFFSSNTGGGTSRNEEAFDVDYNQHRGEANDSKNREEANSHNTNHRVEAKRTISIKEEERIRETIWSREYFEKASFFLLTFGITILTIWVMFEIAFILCSIISSRWFQHLWWLHRVNTHSVWSVGIVFACITWGGIIGYRSISSSSILNGVLCISCLGFGGIVAAITFNEHARVAMNCWFDYHNEYPLYSAENNILCGTTFLIGFQQVWALHNYLILGMILGYYFSNDIRRWIESLRTIANS